MRLLQDSSYAPTWHPIEGIACVCVCMLRGVCVYEAGEREREGGREGGREEGRRKKEGRGMRMKMYEW